MERRRGHGFRNDHRLGSTGLCRAPRDVGRFGIRSAGRGNLPTNSVRARAGCRHPRESVGMARPSPRSQRGRVSPPVASPSRVNVTVSSPRVLPSRHRSRPRVESLQPARGSAADRLDLEPGARRPRQPRALLVLQRRRVLSHPRSCSRQQVPHRDGGAKDSLRNIRETGEFVVNLATWALRDAVNATSASAPGGVDEFELAGLTKEPARIVQPPRVAESPVHLECALTTIVELPTPDPEDPNTVVFGEVVGIHIADEVIVSGRVDVLKLDPIARLGYAQYTRVTDIFAMTRPP